MKRSVLVQRSMSPQLIVVRAICAQDAAQVRFTEHDGVVEAFPADRAYESFNVSILPGIRRRLEPFGLIRLATWGSNRPSAGSIKSWRWRHATRYPRERAWTSAGRVCRSPPQERHCPFPATFADASSLSVLAGAMIPVPFGNPIEYPCGRSAIEILCLA